MPATARMTLKATAKLSASSMGVPPGGVKAERPLFQRKAEVISPPNRPTMASTGAARVTRSLGSSRSSSMINMLAPATNSSGSSTK